MNMNHSSNHLAFNSRLFNDSFDLLFTYLIPPENEYNFN